MLQYIVRRIIYLIPTIIAISMISFIIIELPPGDYVTTMVSAMQRQGEMVDESVLATLKKQYGLDQPVYVRYFIWAWNSLHGDFGRSFEWGKPVSEVIGDRLVLTVVISLAALLFTWVVALPVGIYSATHQYSIPDYIFSMISFIGRGVPEFLIALVFLWVAFSRFGVNLGGLFSDKYLEAPWSMGKVLDMLNHLWLPMVVLGIGGTAGMIRTMRANLLDELHKPYVVTARAKGLTENRLIFKYPVRVALNPFVATIGWTLPALVSGATIISLVLSLPTVAPVIYKALMTQDMYLAGSFIMLVSILTVMGTLISDILLAWLDPRIRYES
jgi:peptide/nickel transport system permease protein